MPSLADRVVDLVTGTHGEVGKTAEFDRVIRLPYKRGDDGALAGRLTKHLGGVGMKLFPVQAEALLALDEVGGCFADVPVGEGKTLISYLAPAVARVKRAVLLVPAKLRRKTMRDFRQLSQHWPDASPGIVRSKEEYFTTNGDRTYHVVSYTELSRDDTLLERFNPELIVLDECHHCRNLRAGCTRRLVRYLRSHDTRVVAMSGTATGRSILDFWHFLAACVGVDRMPLPRIRSEAIVWARAVDEKTEIRARPGALVLLTKGETDLASVRAAVGRRIYKTPGVVQRVGGSCSTNLTIEKLSPRVPPLARMAFRELSDRGVDPNGEECTPADVWRHTRTLALGFAYVWREKPPEDWRKARARWSRRARRALEGQVPGWDTQKQVERTAEKEGWPEWIGWKEVKDDFKPESIPRWYDESLLQWVADHYHRDDWLIWTVFVAVGNKLSKLMGIPYFRHKGFDRKGKFVEDHDGPAVLSVGGCSEGVNLQYKWTKNLVLTPMTTGKEWEQLLGRTHRRGQLEDVDVQVLVTHQRADLEQAIADAQYRHSTSGSPQKLLLADWAD